MPLKLMGVMVGQKMWLTGAKGESSWVGMGSAVHWIAGTGTLLAKGRLLVKYSRYFGHGQ